MGFRFPENAAKVLTSPPLFLSLALLLLNDWYLKAAYHNALTGKLSDFAGVFLLSIVAFALWPRRKGAIAVVVVLAFISWKSPLSEPLITLVNTFGPTGFGRVVDMTDLAALAMVPLAWRVATRVERGMFRCQPLRPVLALSVLAVCSLSMVATTYATMGSSFDVEGARVAGNADRQAIAMEIDRVAGTFRLSCVDCREAPEKGYYRNDQTRLSYEILDSGTVSIRVRAIRGGRVKRISRVLQEALGGKVENLVFQ